MRPPEFAMSWSSCRIHKGWIMNYRTLESWQLFRCIDRNNVYQSKYVFPIIILEKVIQRREQRRVDNKNQKGDGLHQAHFCYLRSFCWQLSSFLVWLDSPPLCDSLVMLAPGYWYWKSLQWLVIVLRSPPRINFSKYFQICSHEYLPHLSFGPLQPAIPCYSLMSLLMSAFAWHACLCVHINNHQSKRDWEPQSLLTFCDKWLAHN